ncbi:creatininase family protein [Streptomyces radicis]|uniref:Creatininase family protein n=1 Tax=Streptomyces radicis TaxID=1750517 RepID=A0A3A9WBW3_9ACTN|nr:creatininase family protein [Streptomyces radicis]RKN10851.1 creatininase family protein [Streptomyces radicis]RKN25115.1 creatininase family protein [Streptomyces radicis]
MSAPRPHHLGDMTTAEAAEAVTASPVVLIPAGAFEQHGPGLPLATDLIRAERVCDLVAAGLAGRAVIGPSLPVGVSPHHRAFAGTVSIRPATLAALVAEYAADLHRHGWRKLLVVTGHAGNNATLGTVAQELLGSLPELEFAWTPLTALAGDVVAGLGVSEVHGHSGEAETAQLLHLAPHLVRADRLTAGSTAFHQLTPLARLTRGGHPALALPYERLTPNGVLGDPTRVTPDDGAAVVDAIVSRLVAFVDAWLAA